MTVDLSGLQNTEAFRKVRPAVFFHSDEIVAPLKTLAVKDVAWSNLLRDALEGTDSVANAASLPYSLTWRAEVNRRFGHMNSAEQIRAIPLMGGEASDQAKLQARHEAERKMEALLNSSEGQYAIVASVFQNLQTQIEDPTIRSALKELLIQTMIATWSLFETFASSFIIAWLNAKPQCVKLVVGKPELKPFFGRATLDIDVIGDHGFDLTRSMGTVLFQDRRLDNLNILRNLFDALFDDDELRGALGKKLWTLNQRRHLFVHKRGIVDLEYQRKTGEVFPIGERLTLSSPQVEEGLTIAVQAIVAISNAATSAS